MTAFAPALVAFGGVAGALARYGVDRAVTGEYGTVVVNVLGSVALGLVTAVPVGDPLLLVLGTGFCGAFTTFSSFAVTIAERVRDGRYRYAAGYAGGTLLAALAGVGLGAWIAGTVA
jgi:CrcB protein